MSSAAQAPSNEEKLLQRIEAELAFHAAATPVIGSAWPRRAAGSVELIRLLQGGEELVAEALAARPEHLQRALFTEDVAHLPHTLVHHIAVLHAWALEANAPLDRHPQEGLRAPPQPLQGFTSHRHLRGLIACWLVLGEDAAHLRACAHAAGGSEEHTESLLRALQHRGLQEAETRARAGLHACTAEGQVAVRVLCELPELMTKLALSEETNTNASTRARASIDQLASQWIGSFRDALDEARARNETSALITAMEEAAATWRYLGREPEVERQVVIALPTIAWPLYREGAMQVLGRIVDPITPLMLAIEARILTLRDQGDVTTELAYLAPTAQAFVFWAETTKDVALAMERAERAFLLCPTLRNARIVLSHLLCDRADRTLASGQLWPTHPAKDDVLRAREVFPEFARLASLLARVGVAS